MPGIVGIISRERPAACRRRVAMMLETMLHEPWYVSGHAEAVGIGVYAGWVAHPGSLAERESGTRADGTLELVLAGETFHDVPDAAHRDVERRARDFQGILASYQRLDQDAIPHLNGSFSGMIIDRRRPRAMLFNDRYGLERVYVHQTKDVTYFASEAKALLRVLPAQRSFDDEGVAQFLNFGCALDGRTLFRGIHTLPAGSLWVFEGGICRKQRYFVPAEWERQTTLDHEAYQSEFEHTFNRVLPRYLRGKAPIGISLTGGLDSRMIVASLPSLGQPPICYTFAPHHGETLDTSLAARVAAACGLEHRLLRIGRDFFAEFAEHVDRTVYLTDGTAGALGSHEIYLNGQARHSAPIRLTGNFGGEVLRGVSTFKPLKLCKTIFASGFRAQVDAVAETGVQREQSAVTFAAFREIPCRLYGTMASAKTQVMFRTPYLDNDLVALTYRAPANARRSSTPALRLVLRGRASLGAIPTDQGVFGNGAGVRQWPGLVLSSVTFKLDYLHQEAPPPWMMRIPGALSMLDRLRRHHPHRFLSYRRWFQNELADYLIQNMEEVIRVRQPFWDTRVLATIARDHVTGRRNYVREIDAVLTLAAVERLLLRREGRSSVPDG